LRDLLFLALPASIGLFAFREEIIRIIFESGAFSSASTALVVAPLGFFALALVFYSLVEVLARSFYAMRIVNIPVIAGISIMVINVLLAVWLTPRIGFTGLALALALSTAIEAIILVVALGFVLGRFDVEFGVWFAKVGAASAITALIALVMSDYLNAQLATGAIGRWFGLLFLMWAMALCGGVYAVTTYALRLPECDRWLGIVRRVAGRLSGGRI
jgi:putative peptidoglycan lipid II flippase